MPALILRLCRPESARNVAFSEGNSIHILDDDETACGRDASDLVTAEADLGAWREHSDRCKRCEQIHTA